MSQDLDCLRSKRIGTKIAALPFAWLYPFELLGALSDGNWNFRQHFQGPRGQASARFRATLNVGYSVWALEARIPPMATHALPESAIRFGWAITRGNVNLRELRRVDAHLLDKAASKIVGIDIATNREILFTLAIVKTSPRYYVLKKVNTLARVLRADGTGAQRNARGVMAKIFGVGAEYCALDFLWQWRPMDFQDWNGLTKNAQNAMERELTQGWKQKKFGM